MNKSKFKNIIVICVIMLFVILIAYFLISGIQSTESNNAVKPYEVFANVLSSKENVRIKLLGDSITHGVGGTGFNQNGYHFINGYARNPDGYCWANTFRDYMEDKFQCSVINNACTGTTIEFIIV